MVHSDTWHCASKHRAVHGAWSPYWLQRRNWVRARALLLNCSWTETCHAMTVWKLFQTQFWLRESPICHILCSFALGWSNKYILSNYSNLLPVGIDRALFVITLSCTLWASMSLDAIAIWSNTLKAALIQIHLGAIKYGIKLPGSHSLFQLCQDPDCMIWCMLHESSQIQWCIPWCKNALRVLRRHLSWDWWCVKQPSYQLHICINKKFRNCPAIFINKQAIWGYQNLRRCFNSYLQRRSEFSSLQLQFVAFVCLWGILCSCGDICMTIWLKYVSGAGVTQKLVHQLLIKLWWFPWCLRHLWCFMLIIKPSFAICFLQGQSCMQATYPACRACDQWKMQLCLVNIFSLCALSIMTSDILCNAFGI